MTNRKVSDPNALQNAINTGEELVKKYSGEASKVLIKPKPVAPKENWVQKLTKKVKRTFSREKVSAVEDPKTARTKDVERQLYSSGLTPDEIASLQGKKKR
jgi:hypothetical protein